MMKAGRVTEAKLGRGGIATVQVLCGTCKVSGGHVGRELVRGQERRYLSRAEIQKIQAKEIKGKKGKPKEGSGGSLIYSQDPSCAAARNQPKKFPTHSGTFLRRL
jgi:hypothetical protein